MAGLDDLKKFGISKNFFRQVVKPLHNSNNVINSDGLLGLLQKIHSSLWTKSGRPDGFSGAVAGNFQEILDGYKTAVVLGHKVRYGSDAQGVGGDTVKEIVSGEGKFVVTSQFKVSASHAGEIRHHICKAAWQLTGAGGEKPALGSDKVIEVVVQSGSAVEPNAKDAKALKDFDQNDWCAAIVEALSHGYSDQDPKKSKEELYAATDKVFITTSEARFEFSVAGGSVTFVHSEPPKRQHGYTFSQGRINQHWLWLTNDYWNTIKFKDLDFSAIQKFGIGSGKQKTIADLPFQANL
jgi:hypothetical protein